MEWVHGRLFLSCGLPENDGFAGFGLMFNPDTATFVQFALPAMPILAVPLENNTIAWLFPEPGSPDSLDIRLFGADERVWAPLAELRRQQPDAAIIAFAVFPTEARPHVLLAVRSDDYVSYRLFDPLLDLEAPVFLADLAKASFQALPVMPRPAIRPDAQELPSSVLSAVPAESAVFFANQLDAKADLSTTLSDSGGMTGAISMFSAFPADLRLIASSILSDRALFAFVRRSPDRTSLSGSSGLGLLVYEQSADAAGKVILERELPEIRLLPDLPLNADFGPDALFALNQAYDNYLYLRRYALDGTDSWLIRLPLVVETVNPLLELYALPDGSCLISQAANDSALALSITLVDSSGAVRWIRLVEPPRELQAYRQVAGPQIGLSNSAVCIFWPPLRSPAEEAAMLNLPAALARSAWYAEITFDGGMAKAWQLTLPDHSWQLTEQLGWQSEGFAMYEAQYGHLFLLTRETDDFRLRSFVVPDFIRSSLGEYDLQQRLARQLEVYPVRGGAIMVSKETDGGKAAARTGFLFFDKDFSQVHIGPPGVLPNGLAVDSSRVFRSGTVAYFMLQLSQRLAGFPAGVTVLLQEDLAVLPASGFRLAVEEPEQRPGIVAYALRIATVSGVSAERSSQPESPATSDDRQPFRVFSRPRLFADTP